MGVYLNPGNETFAGTIRGKIYVDKSKLIQFTNGVIGLPDDNRIVVSRPRRFGKTMAIDMLSAYYSRGCDSEELFSGLAIADDPTYKSHLNKYNVIYIDVSGIYSDAKEDCRLHDFRQYISEIINKELEADYPEAVRGNEKNLAKSLIAIYARYKASFIFLLDEWDVIYRDEKFNEELKQSYTGLLRDLFKRRETRNCVSLAYMTGILPIPKQESQSGLNNFIEYTMLDSGPLGEYIGFTQCEVNELCNKWNMPAETIETWYEGYRFGTVGPIYCPASVADALKKHSITNYWTESATSTELFKVMSSTDPKFQKAVKALITRRPYRVTKEKKINFNDLQDVNDAMMALVHLGYLSYDSRNDTVSIPNQEVMEEFKRVMRKIENVSTYEISPDLRSY